MRTVSHSGTSFNAVSTFRTGVVGRFERLRDSQNEVFGPAAEYMSSIEPAKLGNISVTVSPQSVWGRL